MRNKKNTLINLFAALITLGVQMFISFWLSPYVVGKLGEEAYGFLNLANNFVSYASLVAVAINSMACRYISIEYNSGRIEESKKYFCSVFIVNCILYSLIMIVSLIFIRNIQVFVNVSDKLVTQVKLTFLLSFINMGVSLIGTVYTAAAFTTGLMHYNSLIQIVSNTIKSILIFILFITLPPKIYYLSIATLVAGIITFVSNYFLTKKLLGDFDIKLKYYDFKKLIQLVKSGVWMLISNLSNILLNGLDLLISNWYISGTIMGRLSIAKQIPFALSNALGVFSNIFTSALTKIFAEEGENSLIDEVNSQLRITTILFSVPYAGIIIYGREFISIWLKNANYTYEQQTQIYILMIIILLDIICSTYMYSIHSIFISLDKLKIYAIIILISSITSLSITLFLLNISNLGVYAISGTSTVVLGLTNGVIIPAYAAKLLNRPIWIFWKTELKSWITLILISTIFMMLKQCMHISGWISFFVNIIIIGIIGYIFTFIIIFNKQEKREIIKIIKSRMGNK